MWLARLLELLLVLQFVPQLCRQARQQHHRRQEQWFLLCCSPMLLLLLAVLARLLELWLGLRP
jgi:hypothetical protein